MIFSFKGSKMYKRAWTLNTKAHDLGDFKKCNVMVLNTALFWQANCLKRVTGFPEFENISTDLLNTYKMQNSVYLKGVYFVISVLNLYCRIPPMSFGETFRFPAK